MVFENEIKINMKTIIRWETQRQRNIKIWSERGRGAGGGGGQIWRDRGRGTKKIGRGTEKKRERDIKRLYREGVTESRETGTRRNKDT